MSSKEHDPMRLCSFSFLSYLPYPVHTYKADEQKESVLNIKTEFDERMRERMREGVRKRKVRSDKKRDVKPTVHISLYECISRLSYITMTPMKDVAEYLCVRGLNSRKVIEVLSKQFRRNYFFKNTLFIGKPDRISNRVMRRTGMKKRLSIRITQETHDRISELAFALDMTVSSATAILLETAAKNPDFIDQYVSKHVTETLSPARKEQLKEVLRYLKKNNPYAEEITMARLISYIIEEMKEQTIQAKKAVESWLEQNILG